MPRATTRICVILLACALPVAIPLACSEDSTSSTSSSGTASNGTGGASGTAGGNTGGTSNTGGTGVGGTSTSSGGGAWPAECQGHIYECGDGVDNDGDGKIDSQDPGCLGPCDNTEGSYYGGIPGQAGPACKVDCYFDQDSGPGNDDCYWDHICDPLSVSPDYYPEPADGDKCAYAGPNEVISPVGKTCAELMAAQSQECLDYCGPLTPNGCDCFGCCELPAGSGLYVWLGSEGIDPQNPTACTDAELSNPDICHPCTPVQACLNDCGHCELCIGKTELPPDCFGQDGGTSSSGTGGSGSTQCPPNVQPCGVPNQDPCPPGEYCITGCCTAVPE